MTSSKAPTVSLQQLGQDFFEKYLATQRNVQELVDLDLGDLRLSPVPVVTLQADEQGDSEST